MRARHAWAGCRLLLVLALLGALGPPGAAAAGLDTPVGYAQWAKAALASPPPEMQFLEKLERQLIELTNERRAETGERAQLEPDPGLERVARAHALDMLERGYMEHVGPDGRDVGERVGILYRRFIGGAGENLAEQDGIDVGHLAAQTGPLAAKLMEGWMSSPGHRQNILEPEYSHVGLAAAGKGERLVVVQVFGRRSALLARPIPLEVEKGAKLPLEIEPGSAAQAPQKFAFAPPGTATDELVTLDLSSNEVVVEPGQYRLKFFLPTEREGYFSVADGPLLVVRQRAG
jgi:uncharacterized protein YkwD